MNASAMGFLACVLCAALDTGAASIAGDSPDQPVAAPEASFVARPLTLPRGERITCQVRSGEGPTLVLLPGTWGDLQRFTPLIAELPGALPIVVIELPWQGGQAPANVDLSMEQLADDVLWALGELKLQRYFLGGHSLGGMITVEIAGRNVPGMLGAIPMEGWSHHTVVETAFDGVVSGPRSPEEEARYQANRSREQGHLSEAQREAISSIWRRWNGHDSLLRAKMPILHVWGDRGKPRPEREALQIPASPSIEIAWIAGASHMLVKEAPDVLAEAVWNFIEKHTPPGTPSAGDR